MDRKRDTIRLYSAQRTEIIDIVERDGVCYSKEQFINRKYNESAQIFLTAYRWLAREGARFVPKPLEAGLHYWAFTEFIALEASYGDPVLVMDVPVSECLFFNIFDWSKILKLEYIGENEEEERTFREKTKAYGIKHISSIMLSNFYPELKREIENSWQRLFRYHDKLANGERPIATIEAALWQIKNNWIVDIRRPQG